MPPGAHCTPVHDLLRSLPSRYIGPSEAATPSRGLGGNTDLASRQETATSRLLVKQVMRPIESSTIGCRHVCLGCTSKELQTVLAKSTRKQPSTSLCARKGTKAC